MPRPFCSIKTAIAIDARCRLRTSLMYNFGDFILTLSEFYVFVCDVMLLNVYNLILVLASLTLS